MSVDILGFVLVALTAYILPGPDFIITTRHAAISAAAGRAAGFGAQVGLAVHMMVAVAGLSALLAHSPVALSTVKLLGAAYLIWMGASSFLDSLRAGDRDACSAGPAEAERQPEHGRAFREGLITNLLNPGALLFFVSILPQFIGSDGSVAGQFLFLGILDILIGVGFWIVLVSVVRRTVTDGMSETRSVWWERIAALALVLAGVGLSQTNF